MTLPGQFGYLHLHSWLSSGIHEASLSWCLILIVFHIFSSFLTKALRGFLWWIRYWLSILQKIQLLWPCFPSLFLFAQSSVGDPFELNIPWPWSSSNQILSYSWIASGSSQKQLLLNWACHCSVWFYRGYRKSELGHLLSLQYVSRLHLNSPFECRS